MHTDPLYPANDNGPENGAGREISFRQETMEQMTTRGFGRIVSIISIGLGILSALGGVIYISLRTGMNDQGPLPIDLLLGGVLFIIIGLGTLFAPLVDREFYIE